MERTISERGLLAEATSFEQDLTSLASPSPWEQQQQQQIHPQQQQQMVYLDPRAITATGGQPKQYSSNGGGVFQPQQMGPRRVEQRLTNGRRKRSKSTGSYDPRSSPGNQSIRKMLRDLSQGKNEGQKGLVARSKETLKIKPCRRVRKRAH